MLIKIVIALVILIAAFLVVAALQPSAFRVERSATMSASPAIVFSQVNDLHKFQGWSPWARLDANCKTTYEGPPAGAGAAFSWDGNSQVGNGRMTITESQAPSLVRTRLDFEKPFKATNYAEFKFTPQGDQTLVTWSMVGQKNFICKAIGLLMSMDKMCGGQFEQGLSNMKQIVEAEAKTTPLPVAAAS